MKVALFDKAQAIKHKIEKLEQHEKAIDIALQNNPPEKLTLIFLPASNNIHLFQEYSNINEFIDSYRKAVRAHISQLQLEFEAL